MIDVLRKSAVLLIVAAMTATLAAKSAGWLEYKRDNWPVFSYPPGYSLNPRSFGGVDHRDEGTLRLSILTSPETDLEILSSNYGFIPDLHEPAVIYDDYPRGGFDNPRDVLLLSLGGDPFRVQCKKEHSFEVFRVTGDSHVKVYFLMKDPEWGQCYQFLEFLFEQGNYSKHEKTINLVIASFKPSFVPAERKGEVESEIPTEK